MQPNPSDAQAGFVMPAALVPVGMAACRRSSANGFELHSRAEHKSDNATQKHEHSLVTGWGDSQVPLELTFPGGFGGDSWERCVRETKRSEETCRERNPQAHCSRTGTKGSDIGYWLMDQLAHCCLHSFNRECLNALLTSTDIIPGS